MRHKPTHGGRSNRDPFCSPADSGKAIDLLHFGTICGFMQVETGTGDSATSVDAKTLDLGHGFDYVCTIANASATNGETNRERRATHLRRPAQRKSRGAAAAFTVSHAQWA